MSEIDRIISKGIINKAYLVEEYRCDFLVKKQRKLLWAVMLDMLFELEKVCQKHGLRYYAMYGTLLGAVRHKGFIPWDDDFDIVMPRADYEIFIKLSSEFSYPYFLQIPNTDNEYYYSFAKIRNTNTCGIVEMFKYTNINHGIWISVFPLDYWDNNGGEERYLKIRELVMRNSTYMRINNPNLGEKDRKRVAAYLAESRDPLKDYETIQKLASECSNPDARNVMVAVLTQYEYKRALFDTKDFIDTVLMEFEGLTVPVPNGYDHILKTIYGNYMEYPPLESRGMWHSGVIFNTDISYLDYLDF